MLVGLNKETGEKVYAFTNTEYVKKLTENKILVCQDCGFPLMLKAGNIKVHHFAHNKCTCTYQYGEAETEEHIRGKLEMFEQLQRLYPNSKVELEYKVEETNQRADVMVIHPNGEKWAFEIQCSRISVATIIERSMLYRTAGIIDNWFLGYEYSSYFSYSSRNKLGETLDLIRPRLFRIFFEKKIEVGHLSNSDMLLEDMILKKKVSYFILQSMKAYKRACQLHKMTIKAFYKYLKDTYPNSEVYLKYPIGECNEKADIIVVSKKTTDMCAFNFIYPYIKNKPVKERVVEYQKKGIKAFWFYGNFVIGHKTCYENEGVMRGDNVFDLMYEERKWTIVEQAGGFLASRIPLENLKIAYKRNTKELTLKDGAENISLNKDILKRIKWTKFGGVWSGMVYKCPQSTLEEHDLRLKDISICEKCRYFNGYVYEHRKKVSIKCKGEVRKE